MVPKGTRGLRCWVLLAHRSKGEFDRLFGVCANKWSPDDGRVVSLDHGCGEHSEIEPPEPSRSWVQAKPAFDDLHIDVVANRPHKQEPIAQDDVEDETGEAGEPAGDDIEAWKSVGDSTVDTEITGITADNATMQSQSSKSKTAAQDESDSTADVDVAESADESESTPTTRPPRRTSTTADDDEDDEMCDDEEGGAHPSA